MTVHVWALNPGPHRYCVHSQPQRQSFKKDFELAVKDIEWDLKRSLEAVLFGMLRKNESGKLSLKCLPFPPDWTQLCPGVLACEFLI